MDKRGDSVVMKEKRDSDEEYVYAFCIITLIHFILYIYTLHSRIKSEYTGEGGTHEKQQFT